MGSFKDPSFQDRVGSAAEAKKKALELLRSKPPVDEAVAAAKREARLAKEAAEAEKRAAKKAAKEQQEADKIEAKRAAEQAAAEQAAAEQAAAEEEAARARPAKSKLTEEERKAARDARYAARKKRK